MDKKDSVHLNLYKDLKAIVNTIERLFTSSSQQRPPQRNRIFVCNVKWLISFQRDQAREH